MSVNANPGVFINSLSSAERKEVAVSRGLYAYFPDALALIARHSIRSNEKHNPGQEPHWAREKSTDHEDCIARHSLSIAIDPNSLDDGQPHIICRAWRALAALQLWAEAQHEKQGVTCADLSDGWIRWDGGKCPVDSSTKVLIRCRIGGESKEPLSASSFYWEHDNGEADIIAYKVVK